MSMPEWEEEILNQLFFYKILYVTTAAAPKGQHVTTEPNQNDFSVIINSHLTPIRRFLFKLKHDLHGGEAL